jgi:hypothetical protein
VSCPGRTQTTNVLQVKSRSSRKVIDFKGQLDDDRQLFEVLEAQTIKRKDWRLVNFTGLKQQQF